MTDTTDDAVMLPSGNLAKHIGGGWYETSDGQRLKRMTTDRQHTLVPCATCGTGDQPKHMVLGGDEGWLCTQCAGAEIERLQRRLATCERGHLVHELGSEEEAERYLAFINQPNPEPPHPRRKGQP